MPQQRLRGQLFLLLNRRSSLPTTGPLQMLPFSTEDEFVPRFRREGAQANSEREQRWRAYLDNVARGETQSLTLLYNESAPGLLALAGRMLRNDADAEEIILEVFEQVWHKASSFDATRGSVWGWLTLLARSRTLDRLRASTSRLDRDRCPITDHPDLVSNDPLPDYVSIFRQERTLIKRALQSLPEEQRQALELAFFSGLTHMEISSSLALPLGTVKTRIRIAMEKLRIFLSQARMCKADSVR